MHQSVLNWVQEKVDQYGIGGNVLEVGSRNINGSVRPIFKDAREYLGIDIIPGNGVDKIVSAHDMSGLPGWFDTVVCTEVLEHDEAFWLSLQQMNDVLRCGGWLLLTCRGIGFPYHEYPGDYYRFTKEALEFLLPHYGFKVVEVVENSQCSGVFALGMKV